LACGIFPFVWKDYDKKNTIVASKFQRISSVDEFYEKLPEVNERFSEVENHYFAHTLKSKDWYYKQFSKKLNSILQY
jgi:hypothetical protein